VSVFSNDSEPPQSPVEPVPSTGAVVPNRHLVTATGSVNGQTTGITPQHEPVALIPLGDVEAIESDAEILIAGHRPAALVTAEEAVSPLLRAVPAGCPQ
jgi:hypothetical protein